MSAPENTACAEWNARRERGLKRRDVFLVRVSSTFRHGDVFVDEFVKACLFEFGKRKQDNHAWDRICIVALPCILCSKSYSRSRKL